MSDGRGMLMVPASHTSPPAGGEISSSGPEISIFEAVRRHKLMVAGLVGTATIAAIALGQCLTPLYSAEAVVLIEPREPSRTALSSDPTALPPSEETLRKNEIAVIQSRNLAEEVVERLSLEDVPEFNPVLRPPALTARIRGWIEARLAALLPAALLPTQREPPPESEDQATAGVVDSFRRSLDTISGDASRVVGILFQSEDPVRAARVANAVAEQYISQKREAEIAAATSAIQTLETRIEEIDREIYDTERRVEEARRESEGRHGGNARTLAEQFTEMSRQLAAATGERMRHEGRLDQLQREGGRPGEADAAVLDSLLVQRLQGDAAVLSARIGQMRTTLGENHPAMIQARAELRDLRARIGQETDKIIESRRRLWADAVENEALLRAEVERIRDRLMEVEASEVDLRVLDREAAAKRALLAQLVDRLNDTKAQMNLIRLQGPEARQIARAVVPPRPSYPPKLAMAAVAFLMSATAATVLAVMRERGNESVRSLVQLRALAAAPILGAVPVVRRRRRGPPPVQVLTDAQSPLTENLRAIWFQIVSAAPASSRVVLITSSVAGEGKSSTAASLARVLALSGHRVVLVDADLRNPTVHKALGLSASPGIAEVVLDGLDIADAVRRDEPSGCFVVTSGRSVPSPADLLQTARFAALVRELSAAFDAVIVDSPPILAVHDAGILALRAHMTVMAVRWRSTKVPALVAALQRLRDLRTPIGGVVMTMVDGPEYRSLRYEESDAFAIPFNRWLAR
ncbi:GumC family protein [Arenibaculum pallidiluteum]|uniref:GumC family protein n=1 Tax=Arenibaculum pallidiluteum TaxID=2812559 RepID=UPI001A97AA0C|nr:polysaccharide biosynthesis tyrosine autokinase [Arenibaculum pallidiluteum]